MSTLREAALETLAPIEGYRGSKAADTGAV